MEPYAAKTILVSLVSDCKLKIATFTTDRSSSIRSMMQDPLLSHIHHEFDPWHWISKFNTIPKQGFGIILKPSYLYLFIYSRASNERCVESRQEFELCKVEPLEGLNFEHVMVVFFYLK